MQLNGGIDLNDGGMVTSIKNMILQTDIMGVINDNIQGFNKVGFQRKAPVVSSFAEFFGTHALSQNVDEEVGRIKITKNPLDMALACKGYFQILTPQGIQLTRDGRFKLDKEGNLLTLQDNKVLSRTGKPVKLGSVPATLEDIKIDKDGNVRYFDAKKQKVSNAGFISVITNEGTVLENPDIKQGYVEESNVALHNEFFSMVPVRRNFQANRQLFLIQNDSLSKAIQELGRT